MNRLGWVLGLLLGACAGGQTGDTGGGGSAALPCTKSDVELELDQRLPAGYTPRDLIEVFDGATAQGYLFPLHTPADDRALEPDDALAMAEVKLAFEPADGESIALFEGVGCAYAGFAVFGTLTATTLEGEVVLSADGGLAGPPERAYFWRSRPGMPRDTPSTGPYPSTDLYGSFPSCNPDVSPISAWLSNGTLMGNLCTSEGLVRFPTACGGYAEVALDEDVEGELQLPSAVLERLEGAVLEVAWSERERSPLELTIGASDVACYQELGYDDGNERPALTSTTGVDVAVTIDDVGVDFQQEAMLTGSYGYLDDDRESVSRLRVCTDLSSDAVGAFNERLDRSFRHIRACLSIVVREDERLEIALELTGGSTMPSEDTEPPEPIELMERVLVLEVEP